jgi:hypothetical protein
MSNETQPSSDKKMSIKVEFILILILGFLLGVAIKTEAAKRITIGFSDYKVENLKQDYDIEKIQNELIEKSKNAQTPPGENAPAEEIPEEPAENDQQPTP